MKYVSSVLSGANLPTGDAVTQCEGASTSGILAGNLEPITTYSSDEFDDSLDESSANPSVVADRHVDIRDLKHADKIIFEKLGVNNTIEHLILLLISGELSVTDILVQALTYRVQKIIHGKHSMRYSNSYGMFWAGVRNIVKTRGLVVFREHFPIPSCLSLMKKKVIQSCQLDPSSLGKSGLQKQNLEIWIRSKQTEIAPNQLCVSIAADAKKISASTGGHEDLSGLGGRETTSDEWVRHQKNKKCLLDMLISVDTNRQSCHAIYDKLTIETVELAKKFISFIKRLVS